MHARHYCDSGQLYWGYMDILRSWDPTTNWLKECIIINTFSDPITKDTSSRVKRWNKTQGALQLHSTNCTSLQTSIPCFYTLCLGHYQHTFTYNDLCLHYLLFSAFEWHLIHDSCMYYYICAHPLHWMCKK